jgi:NTE family protein
VKRPEGRATAPADDVRIDRRARVVLAVTSIAVFMSFLDVTIVNIAFPDLQRDFAPAPVSALSWVINGYSVVFAAALVPAGRLADRVGRRRLFLLGVAGFVVTSALCALAPTPEVLVAARLVQALAAAMLVPTSLALLLAQFPAARRATATAIWGATGAVAAATGPALGGLLVGAGGWRWVFLVNVPIGVAALVLARRVLIEWRDPDRAVSPDWWGSVLLAAGVAAVALAVVQGPEWGWTDPRVVGSGIASVALLAAFARRSARHPAPVVDPALFRIRSFAVANVATVVFGVGFYALLLCNVLFLTGVWRFDVVLAGAALTPGAVTAALLAPLGGRAVERRGPRAVAVTGALVFAAGAAVLASRTGPAVDYAGAMLPGMLLTGAGIGLTISSLGAAAVLDLPRARFATGSAVTACLRQIGAVLGIAVLIAVVGGAADTAADPARAVAGFHAAWWLMSATGLATAAIAAGLGAVRATAPAPTAASPAA